MASLSDANMSNAAPTITDDDDELLTDEEVVARYKTASRSRLSAIGAVSKLGRTT